MVNDVDPSFSFHSCHLGRRILLHKEERFAEAGNGEAGHQKLHVREQVLEHRSDAGHQLFCLWFGHFDVPSFVGVRSLSQFQWRANDESAGRYRHRSDGARPRSRRTCSGAAGHRLYPLRRHSGSSDCLLLPRMGAVMVNIYDQKQVYEATMHVCLCAVRDGLPTCARYSVSFLRRVERVERGKSSRRSFVPSQSFAVQ